MKKSDVQEHLAACKSCDQEMRAMREALENLSALDVVLLPSEDGWERLALRIEGHRRSSAASRTEYRIAGGVIVLVGVFCLLWLLKINEQVLHALRATLNDLGTDWPWLFEGPLSSFLAPLIFIALCSAMTLVLSPLLLRKKKAAREKAATMEERKVEG